MSRRCWTQFALLLGLAFAGGPLTAQAQGTQADYARAQRLPELTRNKVFRHKVEPHWFDNQRQFWYRNELAEGTHEFIAVDAKSGSRQPAFDHAQLAKGLSQLWKENVVATRLPFSFIELSAARDVVRFNARDKGWEYRTADGTLTELAKLAPPAAQPKPATSLTRGPLSPRGEKSPDGKWLVVAKDHNLLLRSLADASEVSLTQDGKAGDSYSPAVYWSPDSSRFLALKTLSGDTRTIHFVESTPQDQLQPRLHSLDYLKPGDRLPVPRPFLFEVATKKRLEIASELFPLPWSLDEVHWFPDSQRVSFLYNQRGHQVLRIVVVDATTGEAAALVDETSPTFLDYAHKRFSYYLDSTHELLWMSERDGWNHLYLYDSRTGDVSHQITRGTWVVRGVDRVDETHRQIWFRAGGIYPEQDPYYIHHCRVNFDGSGLVVLTAGNGTHEVQPSPDGEFFLDSYSRVDLPPVTELRNSRTGKLVCELERADWSPLLATGWRAPERFSAKGRDGQTDIFGIIHRPTTFDPQRKYPVIEAIYAGPHGAHVPKKFSPMHWPQTMAELGFIVVQIDGMGTSHRSKAFHDVACRNLIDAGFPDRILWMKAAARKDPAFDLTRVGIYGGSAGGQNALAALLTQGDFYKVAVSDCGCHDNRMDKIWWNELWMGYPVGPHYAANSNITHAAKLQGKLLLMVGELDRNVDPASTMQVVHALIKADRDFDLLVIPGGGHGSGSPYAERRRRDFFVRHLLHVEPRSQP